MKCPSCGTEDIDEKALFCPSCENYLPRNNYARRATFWHRLAAFAIDLIAIWGTPILVLFALARILYQQSSLFIVFNPPPLSVVRGASLTIIWITVAVIFISWILYIIYLILQLGKGSTPGKYFLKLRVVNAKEEPEDKKAKGKYRGRHIHVDFWTMFVVREILGRLVSMAGLFLGYLWALWDKEGQTWHDKIAGTAVIQLTKEAIAREASRKKAKGGGILINLRENAAAILFILVVFFLLSLAFTGGLGGANIIDDIVAFFTGEAKRGVIARVNGQDIRAQYYYEQIEQRQEEHRKRTGESPEGYQLENLENQIWEEMIQAALLHQYIDEHKIVATPEEVVYQVEHNPPQEIRQIENLQTDGKFDPKKYEQYVLDGQSEQALQIIHYMEERFQSQIPFQKLSNMIQQTVRVSLEEIKEEYIKKNQNVKVRYIFFDPNEFRDAEIEIDDDELRSYYKEHEKDYMEAEKRRIEYVLFSTKTMPEDSSAIRERAAEFLQRAKKGKDFAMLATDYSDDKNTKEKGGDLGFFARTGMPAAFTDSAFSAEPGDIVGPIETHLGIHIIKVEEKKKEEDEEQVRARHILLKFQPSETTVEDAYRFAKYFSDRVKDEPFNDVVKTENLNVDTTNFFVDGGFIPGIGRDIKAAGFIFNNYVGMTSRVYKSPNAYYVFRILDKQPEHIRPFDEVKTQIKSILTRQKRTGMAGEKCKKAYEHIERGLNLVEAADQDSLEVKETDEFTKSGYVSEGVGRDAKFIGTTFGIDVGQISKPFEGVRGYYILEVIDKTPFDEAEFNNQKNRLKAELLRQKQQRAFANWYNTLKENSDIEDYRIKYY